MSARVRLPLLLVPVALLALLPLLASVEAQQESVPTEVEPPPAVVEVAAAQAREFAPLAWLPGSVLSRGDARLASESEGRAQWVAEVGDWVAAGAELARIDDAALRLRESAAELEIERIGARLELAGRQQERLERLARDGVIARAQLEQTRAEHEVLGMELESARVHLEQVRLLIERSVVRAPFAGVVAERYVEPGERVAIGMPMLRLVDTRRLEVRVRAPVAMAAHLATGDTVRLRAADSSLDVARISALVPVGDEASRQIELRIGLDDTALPVGSAIEVGTPAASPRSIVAVSRDALLLRREGSYVMRIDDARIVEQVPVTTGEVLDGQVEVEGAIRPGDLVVVRGGERLRPGQRVAWTDTAPEPLALVAGPGLYR